MRRPKARKATPEKVAALNRALDLRGAPDRLELGEDRRLHSVASPRLERSSLGDDLVIFANGVICFYEGGSGPNDALVGFFDYGADPSLSGEE